MNVLLVGGAGHVGTIVRPALEAEHTCRYFDRRAIPEVGGRSIVGDVNDDQALEAALPGTDAVVYLAMGVNPDSKAHAQDLNAAFDVNVRGAYRWLGSALKAGVSRFIYASSLSVYVLRGNKGLIDEEVRPNCFDPYGMSKRLGEFVCEAGGQAFPEATIIALRLYMPRNEAYWRTRDSRIISPQTGPRDTCRLFLAALRLSEPGVHILQASGDMEGKHFPNTRVRELLGWEPRGE